MAKSPRGLYRTAVSAFGARYVAVGGEALQTEGMTEETYRRLGYEPSFNELPTQEEYETRKS